MRMNADKVHETGASWLSAYLYYGKPWDAFLPEAIFPFATEAISDELAEQFFFIRFSERGPHVRLRFKGNKDVLEDKLKPRLEAFFLDYFGRYPSKRVEPSGSNDLGPSEPWYPNNSIQYVRYEPEIDRYGGAQGILIAEKQFEVSSRTVLLILKEAQKWNYERALGAAIQLHLAFAWGLGMSLVETASFFSQVCRNWFRAALASVNVVADSDQEHKGKIVSKVFEKSFDAQETVLVPLHQELWNAFHGGVGLEVEWMHWWIEETKKIANQLEECREARQLVTPAWFKPDLTIPVAESRQMLWPILESYVHMTNNRLGILNQDEAFLGYLMSRSLECIAGVRGER